MFSDVIHTASVSSRDQRKTRVPLKSLLRSLMLTIVSVLPSASLSREFQTPKSSQEIHPFKSQLPIWYCQKVYNFVPVFSLRVGK